MNQLEQRLNMQVLHSLFVHKESCLLIVLGWLVLNGLYSEKEGLIIQFILKTIDSVSGEFMLISK